MNTDNSWIKLPRMFMNWQWYQNTNMVHLYLYLLLNANIEISSTLEYPYREANVWYLYLLFQEIQEYHEIPLRDT